MTKQERTLTHKLDALRKEYNRSSESRKPVLARHINYCEIQLSKIERESLSKE